MDGSRINDGVYIGVNFHRVKIYGGTFKNGRFYDVEVFGGEFVGALFQGSVFHGGNFLNSVFNGTAVPSGLPSASSGSPQFSERSSDDITIISTSTELERLQ